MARIRTVKPEFWTSEQISECSTIARLLFIGMWNFCDDGGNHPASLKQLKMQIFPSDDISISEIDEMVKELLKNDLIAQYTVNNKDYWHVLGWHHQKIDKPTYKHPDYVATNRQQFVDNSSNTRQPLTPVRESKGMEGKGMELNKKNNASEEKSEQAIIDKLTNGQFAKPDKFKMHLEWTYSKNFESTCKFAGRDITKLTDDVLRDFIVYHEAKENYKNQKEWESALLSWLTNHINKPKKQGITQQTTTEEPKYNPPIGFQGYPVSQPTPEEKAEQAAYIKKWREENNK